MRPYQYNRGSEACPRGSYKTGDLGGNYVSFGNKIPNPLIFTGSSWPVST